MLLTRIAFLLVALLRLQGHGALLENLNEIDADLIFIKVRLLCFVRF